MKITVDANRVTKNVHNFWNHIHFHPTDAIEDDWGQRILNRVAEDKVAKTVRFYAMLEDIVTIDENGKLHYDFTLNDTRIDYILLKGFDILLSYNFIPPCIASDPEELSTVCKNKTRYKGKFIVTAPPKDYGLWEEICREYTRHIVERYGIETVKKWHLQCFNEPDLFKFFMKNAKDTSERAAEYCKLYNSFQRGILAVSNELKLGGPALAGDMQFFDSFLEYLKANNCRFDFVSVHTYGIALWELQKKVKTFNARNSIEKIEAIKGYMKKYGFEKLPLIIDEWGAADHGYCNIEEASQMMFRETELYSAYFTRMITLYDGLELGIDRMLICLSGQHEMVTDFSGFRSFFTLNFFAKPIYNAFKLGGKLGEEKLWCDTPYITDEYSIFPTKSGDGRVSIMLSHCTDDFKELKEEQLEIKLDGIKGEAKARLWIIDKDNANAYEEFKKIGSPENLTEEHILHIRKKAECVPQDLGTVENGETIKLNAKSNSVMLLEIIPS